MRASHCNSIFQNFAAGILMIPAMNALSNPTGMSVASGSAAATQNGPQLNITASQNAFLNWQSFNIAAGETTVFQQPSAASVVWNRINDPNPSQIYGSLQANGVVVLMNSAGFYFGPNSFVQAAGLVVSTAQLAPQNSGGAWEFNGPPPTASIVNFGKIKVGAGGSAFLIAENVVNCGDITAPGGMVGLAAGQQVLLSERPDGRGLSMKVALPEGSVDNYGHITADAGTIAASAQVVNQNGFVQANSVREQNGVIELVAADQLNLGADSKILANGDGSVGVSSGGSVMLRSGNTFSDAAGSQIDVKGGAQGGNGGNVEISAPVVLSLNSGIDAGAQPGWTAGKLLLDPYDIILDTSGSGSAGGGTVLARDNPSGTLDLNVNSAFANLTISEIFLEARHDITLSGGTQWNLSGTIGANNGGVTSGQLTLEAGNNIIFQDSSAIVDANNWSVSLFAGVDFTSPTLKVVPVPAGNTDSDITHSIYLNGGDGLQGGGSIQTAAGSISLVAGQNIETGSGSLQDANFNSLAVGSASGPVSLSAGNDIQIGSGFVETTTGGNLELTAEQNIQVGMNSGVTATGGGGVNITASAGSLTDSGSIQTDTGDINVTAKQDVTLAGISSSIVTTGGGNIDVTATAGSVNTGSFPNGYLFNKPSPFNPAFYTVSSSLGGISTAAGGNVKITAGLDIISYLPTGNNPAGDAGSGAFGVGLLGDVTLTAGRDIEGHYVVADGTGTINAGVDAGTATTDLALSLIAGGWIVNAAHDINLQEVRNPNGIFNFKGNSSSPAYHYFDYAADDFVDLNAGNEVQLLGNSLPRNSGEPAIPSIYPSTLDITAGAGGVAIDSEVILFPSPLGSLEITTTDRGPLVGPSSSYPLIVSDSGQSQYLFNTAVTSFGAGDHAAVPVHQNSPTPVVFNIAGDMDDLYLIVPEAAQITVGGNMNNCAFAGQNLSSDPSQSLQVQTRQADGSLGVATVYPGVTSITVGGDILNQNIYNSVSLASDPNLSLLNLAFGESYGDLFNRLYYDSATKTLTLQGVLTADEYSALTSLLIQEVDQYGQPEFTYGSDGIATPVLETVSILDLADALKLQSASQGAPSTANPGYVLGGGGAFNITAHTLDLGATLGLQSVGPENNAALAYNPKTGLGFLHGADINVNLSGDLDMFSTTISTLNGGDISVNAAGNVNVGSSYISGNDQYARGIFTVEKSDVTVTAGGDIEVAGSRIAAYDGGNVAVQSLTGNVDAGTGGSGSVAVQEFYVDPLTGQIFSFEPVIPGSGILATTFPPRGPYFPAPVYSVGNILVETPQGNINASAGGIVQLPLNGADSSGATVTLLAGEDAAGNVLSANRDIDVSGSGVIGSIVTLKASGSIKGLVFARNDANVNAQQNADVTVLAEGTATVNAGGNLSGSVIGIGGLSASGASVDASLLSQNISPGVETSGTKGFSAGTAANNASTGLANDQTTKAIASTDTTDDDPNKKRKSPGLMQKVSRVTVILPPKNISEYQNSKSHL